MAVGYAYTIGLGILPNDYLRVAASDATSKSKAGADYVVDGSNDQDDLNTALAEGRAVLCTEGTFALSSPVLVQQEPAMLCGINPGQRTGATQPAVGTKFQVQAGFSGSQAILVQRAADDRPVYGVQLCGFVVDGGNVAGVEGILYRSNRGLIDHVHVHRMGTNGIRLLGYTTPTSWSTYDTLLTRLMIGDNGAAGIVYDTNGTDTILSDSMVFNNQDNIVISGGSSQQINCVQLYDATRYNLFFNGSGSRTKFTNPKIEGAGQHGVNIDSTNGGYADLQFVGGGITSNGDSVTNTYDNVIIQGPTGITRPMFVGVVFKTKSGVTNLPRYAINFVNSQTQQPLVQACTFGPASDYGTGTINNGSTGAIIRDNLGYLTEASGTASIGAASTTATVTHGLSVTPAAKDVILTWAADPGSSTKRWASGFTSTQFTVNVSPAPGGSGTTVAWQAQIL